MADGFAMISDLSSLDKKLKDLANKSEETSLRITNAFKRISTDGVEPLINQVRNLSESIAKVGSKSNGNTTMGRVSKDAAKAVDDVNKVAFAIDKIIVHGEAFSNSALSKINSRLTYLNGQLSRIKAEENKIMESRGSNPSKTSLASLGNSYKTISSEMELLRKERSEIIETSRVKIQQSQEERKIQQERDAEWRRMSDERVSRKRKEAEEIIRIESEALAKNRSVVERITGENIKTKSRALEHEKKMAAERKKELQKLAEEEKALAKIREQSNLSRRGIVDRNLGQSLAIKSRIEHHKELERIEKEAQDKRRESAQKSLDDARKKREAELSKAKTAYARYLKEIDELSEHYGKLMRARIKSKSLLLPSDGQNLKSRMDSLEIKKLALENKYKQELGDVLAKHEAERAKRNLKNFIDNEKEKTRIARAEYSKRAEMHKKANLSSFEGSMASSKRAKNILEQTRAIKNLIAARDRLNKTDSDYQKKLAALNGEIKRNQKEIDKARGKANELANSHRGLMDISGQLQRRLALVFSVSQITGYINKLISVRGEFELQKRSLQAILQNEDKANGLWDKTVQLAVRSPFRVKELVTYTKQLAAYRIESDKLYETNKRLADVSAGLGVDMSRLILAYGQVKAANYLRGTELRQFSEAGVNILGELSKMFSEVEGKAVSVGEVFERVSKRLVTFEDVSKVFKRITDEGGIFYNMQEIQAETLKGQISNLYDSIDLMLNKIGESNDGVLKKGVSAARVFVENWEAIAEAIKVAVTAFASYKIASAFITFATQSQSKALAQLTAAQVKSARATNLLSKAITMAGIKLRTFGVLMKNAIKTSLPIMALAALGSAIYGLATMNDELNEKLKKISEEHTKQAAKIRLVEIAYKKLQATEKKSKDTDLFQEKKKNLQDLLDYAKDKGINIKIKIDEVKKEEIDDAFDKIQKELQQAVDFAAVFKESWAKVQNEMSWGGIFGETIDEDLEDLNESANAFFSATNKQTMDNFMDALTEKYFTLGKFGKELSDQLRQANSDELSWEEIFEKRVNLIFEYEKKMVKNHENIPTQSFDIINEVLRQYRDNLSLSSIGATNDRKEFQQEIDKVISMVKEVYGDEIDKMSDEQKLKLKAEIDTEIASKQLNKWVEKIIKEYAHIKLGINIFFNDDPESNLEDWQKRLENELAKVKSSGKTFGQIIKDNKISFDKDNYEGKTYEQVANTVKSLYEVAKKEKEIYEFNKDNVKVTKEQYDISVAQIPVLKELAKTLGINLEKKEQKKAQNEALKRLKEQIRLLKDAYKLYQETRAHFSKEYSDEQLKKSYGGTFLTAQLGNISNYDLTSKRGLLDSLDKLTSKAKAAGGMLELLKEKSKVEMEVDLDADKEKTESNIKAIEDMFNDYEISIDLENLHIPKELAKRLFGLDAMSLDEIKEKMESLKPTFDGKEDYKKFQEYVKKREELEDKAQLERLKKYSKYLAEAQTERVKIKMEELKQLEEIEKTFSNDKDKSEAKEGVMRATNKKIQELEWSEFKGNDMYLRIFEDLDSTSEAVLTKMEERLVGLKNSLKDLSPSELKEIMSSLEKIKNAKFEQKNLFEQLFDSARRYRKFVKEFDFDDLKEKYVSSTDKENILKTETELLENQVAVSKDKLDNAIKNHGYDSKEAILARQILATNKQNLRTKLAELVAQGKISEELAKQLADGKKASEDLKGTVNEILSQISQGFQALPKMAEDLQQIFGFNLDPKTKDIVDSASAIGGGVANAAMSWMSGDYVGAVTNAIGAISAIFQIGDKKKERKIQREIKYVEELQKQYEKLGEEIEKAYSVDTLSRAMNLSEKNIEEQIRSRKEMIKLEEDKKKTDHDRIKQWNEEIEELQKKQEELRKSQVENMGGTYDYKTAAEEFANAWLQAYQETGDGLDGLKEHFRDFAKDLLLKQAVMTGASEIIKPLEEQITNSLKDDYKITDGEWNSIDRVQEDQLEKLDEFLKDFYGKYQGIFENKGNLGGLQLGIQNITEETAQIIEAYLNSVRRFVADTNSKFTTFLDKYMTPESENPMISQLKIIAKQSSAMREILDSVVMNGHPNGGAGIRVFMN